MICSICGCMEPKMPYYGMTCSKECARIIRLKESLDWIEQTIRNLMLNLEGSR